MGTGVTDLIVSDELLIELTGWSEIQIKGWFGGFRPTQEQQNIRKEWLSNLRHSNPLGIFAKGFYKLLGPIQETDRTKSEVPLASPSLKHLILEVDKYNDTVNNVNVLDQLKDIGNPINFSDRSKMLDALRLVREDLVRAIKTERVLRENPKFRPERFVDNIAAIRALQISDQASSYGKYFDEVMQVAIGVQSELKAIFKG
jgi:hypothetical protein